MAPIDPSSLRPDHVFDGGDLDCGSGLALLIRQNMLEVPVGGVLEVRSSEITVRDELPPWCRMTGHEYLGEAEGTDRRRFFLRRGRAGAEDADALREDQRRAEEFEWRVRARSTGPLASKAYFRNFTLEVGGAASFEEQDERGSGVEYLLAALGGSLTTAVATECRRAELEVDDVEVTVRARLEKVLALLDAGEGPCAFERVELKCFVSTLDDEVAIRAAFDRAVERSPVLQTLARGCELDLRLAIL